MACCDIGMLQQYEACEEHAQRSKRDVQARLLERRGTSGRFVAAAAQASEHSGVGACRAGCARSRP